VGVDPPRIRDIWPDKLCESASESLSSVAGLPVPQVRVSGAFETDTDSLMVPQFGGVFGRIARSEFSRRTAGFYRNLLAQRALHLFPQRTANSKLVRLHRNTASPGQIISGDIGLISGCLGYVSQSKEHAAKRIASCNAASIARYCGGAAGASSEPVLTCARRAAFEASFPASGLHGRYRNCRKISHLTFTCGGWYTEASVDTRPCSAAAINAADWSRFPQAAGKRRGNGRRLFVR